MKLMNIFDRKVISIMVGLVCAMPLFSQTATTTLETPKPLELPNFIIEGVEQLNVRSGIKQMPKEVSILTSSQLDSLNSLDKQSAVLISPDPLPTRSISKSFSDGFLKASLGLYASPELELGYSKNLGGYQLFGNAGFAYSSGDVKRSDFTKFFLKGYSDFIAPDKFFLFGGSRTRTSAYLTNSSYNLYASSLSQQNSSYSDINATKMGFNIETDGNFNNVTFSTGILFNTLQLSSDDKASSYISSSKAFDNEIQGFLKIKSLWNNYQITGNLLLDFHSLRTDALSFLQFDGNASYFTKDFTILGGIGFQTAQNSIGTTRGGVLLKGEVEYRMSQLITMKGSFTSGLENNSFSEFYAVNPYLNFATNIDFMYNIALINGSIILHPNEQLTFSGGLKWRVADRMPFFDTAPNETFTIKYDQGTILELIPELIWDISRNDRFIANMTYSVSALNNFNGSVPYYPLMKLDFAFKKQIVEKLGTQIGLVYVSERDLSVENTDKIDGFMNLSLLVDYKLNKNFLLFANFHNLTSSNIYIWNNYKERNLFANFGLTWQF